MRAILFSWLLIGVFVGGQAAAREPALPREVIINGVEFVLIPEGPFWFTVETGRFYDVVKGDPLYREVRVALDSYYIAKFPARASDFQRFVRSGAARHMGEYKGDEACSVREDTKGDFYLVHPDKDLPVTHLSWNLADEFARWMGFRLPRETEWQKAARGSDQRIWPWGDEYPDDTFAGFLSGTDCSPKPVDSFPKGISPYGVHNMAGNVYEFVADWYNIEHDKTLRDGVRNPPLASTGSLHRDLFEPVKLLKGGRWASNAESITIYSRHISPPEVGFVCYGARFAIDAAAVRTHLARGTASIVRQ